MKRTWCIGQLNSEFIARMEQILHLYRLPYDAAYPLVCFDERPCFLIADTVEPLSMQSGQVAKEHYAYQKNGSCCLLAAIEPGTGNRLAQVYEQRTKRQYALFMKQLAAKYPHAIKILVVQDNLNTHTISAFYETFPAHQAFELSQRFQFFYTPKAASWLNMIEIEFSALAKQCLKRRIPTIQKLAAEVLALVNERQQKKIKINWQFSIQSARDKLARRYREINPDN
ncbi:MAG TPA: IS630 family transposase [Saprospiraceae bacterium]|nr:IS630 family transposase [Saprospiraceae bacterium]